MLIYEMLEQYRESEKIAVIENKRKITYKELSNKCRFLSAIWAPVSAQNKESIALIALPITGVMTNSQFLQLIYNIENK